jgi:trans-aconitate methyltransferase
MADMFCWKDFHAGNSFVMVGCGPLPVTLLHVADRYPTLNIHGLDSDKQSIEVARQVLDVFGVAKAELLHTDGTAFDYAHAKIVYVANLVYPKSAVLKQICRSGRCGTLVILRDPTESGTHLADVGLNAIDKNFSIEGVGKSNRMFASRHIFLRLISGTGPSA